MTEIDQIKKNNKGEIPSGKFDILKVKNIKNPEKELKIFKESIITFLENKDLDAKDPKWNTLLPEQMIKFIAQLVEYDYRQDDLITSVASTISDLKEIKKWQWYSSKLTENGFEVYMSGIFRGVFLPLLHHQGIPHTSLFIERDGEEYPTKAMIDVLTYRKWDPETMILSAGQLSQ